jgi:hypothetical protein
MAVLRLHEQLPPRQICECGKCNWVGLAPDLKPVRRVEKRLWPGDPVPAGECPQCKSLAYLARKGVRLPDPSQLHLY